MKKNSITNKITPCCSLPFSVVYWWVSNLTLNSEADRQFILSKISQRGTIAIDGWKVLINSGTLEADASLTKSEFLAWFDCGRQPSCEQLKLIIEGLRLGANNDDYLSYSATIGDNGSELSVSAINNVMIINDGFLSRIAGRFPNIGNLVLFIAGNKQKLAGNSYRFFVKRKFSIQIENVGVNEIDISDLNIQVKYGDYIGVSAESNSKPYFGVDSSNGVSWFQTGLEADVNENIDVTFVQNASFAYGFEVARNKQTERITTINKIKAIKNAENYNSVRNLIAGITDASPTNQYEIYIPAGTWNEFDWQGKKYVKIFGDISGKTIINLDPLGVMATNVVPSNFSFPTENGKTINNVVQYARHIIFVQDDIHCENLTFKAKDSKYAIHIDDKKYKKAYFKNCNIIEDNCNFPVGMGINGGQEVIFESCILKSLNANKFGFFYHNWNNQSEGNTVTFDRCKFDNCRYGYIDELGSEQTDFINLFNCFSTMGVTGQWLNFLVDITGDSKTYWVNPETGLKEPNPVNVPYCIVVNTTGTKIATLTVSDSANFNTDWSGIPQRDINKIKEIGIIEL